MKFTLRLPEKNVNVTPTSPLRDFMLLLAGLIGILVGIYVVLGIAVDFLMPYISPEIEQKLAAYFSEFQPDASEKNQIVQELTNSIQSRCAKIPYKLTVHVADLPIFNAVALPGGKILLFSELMKQMESENELTFVLAHEMGHFANRDHLRGLGRSLIFMTISVVMFGTDSKVGNFLGEWLNITEMSFSRKQENKADEFALDAVNCMYGHIAGMSDFFKKIGQDEETGVINHYFSSHDESQKRLAHLNVYGQSKNFSRKGDIRPMPAGITY